MDSNGSKHPLPAGPGTRAAAGRRAFWPALAAILLVALFLRGKDLDRGKMSPDDGEFLHSARVHELEPGTGPDQWLAEDRAWAGVLAEDFGRVDGRSTYQHGYLHQAVTRYAVRAGEHLGFGRVTALRLDQAVLGALTALLVALMLRRIAPHEPLVALAGAGLTAVQLGHVLLSRTGWGQIACTFFIVWMMMIAWRMFTEAGERDTGKLVRGALGIALTSLIAYGFHEMATVYTFCLALMVPLLFRTAPNGVGKWPWYSRRVLFGLLGCVPVGALTVLLIAKSEYARETWFASSLFQNLSWWEVRELAAKYLVHNVAVLKQLSWPVLILAPIGLAGAFTRDMRWLIWLVLWIVLPFAILFLRFNYPHLVRIYLPIDVVLLVLAAEGLGVLWGLARGRVAIALADVAALAAIGWCAAVTQATIFTGPDSALYAHRPHFPLPEGRHPQTSFLDIENTLRGLAPAEPVGVAFVWGPAFRVMDLGLPARFVELDSIGDLEGPEAPNLVIAPRKAMGGGERIHDKGGPYRLIARDAYNYLGLYEKAP